MQRKSESSAAPLPLAADRERNSRAALLIGISASLGVIPPLLAIFLPQEVDYLGGAL
jgi:VIT1/CCC1 family predicted Fe2+/Mn2+ transporter